MDVLGNGTCAQFNARGLERWGPKLDVSVVAKTKSLCRDTHYVLVQFTIVVRIVNNGNRIVTNRDTLKRDHYLRSLRLHDFAFHRTNHKILRVLEKTDPDYTAVIPDMVDLNL